MGQGPSYNVPAPEGRNDPRGQIGGKGRSGLVGRLEGPLLFPFFLREDGLKPALRTRAERPAGVLLPSLTVGLGDGLARAPLRYLGPCAMAGSSTCSSTVAALIRPAIWPGRTAA